MAKADYIDFQTRTYPLGYLITFRCYGTWLHGDERGSVDRFHNWYGTPTFSPNPARQNQNSGRLRHAPVSHFGTTEIDRAGNQEDVRSA